MNLKEYQELCKKTAKEFENKTEEIMTLGLGIAGEAGDVAGCIKKTFAHNGNQKQGIRENLGDTLWYIAMISDFFDWNLEEILQENIDKLKARHGEGFKDDNFSRENKRVDWNEQKIK